MRQLVLDVDTGQGAGGRCSLRAAFAGRKSYRARILIDVDDPERGWRPGGHILIDLPDGQTVRGRAVNVSDDGATQVVPVHAIVIGTA